MANGIAIKDVTNKLQGLNGEEVIPISTGADEPEVVEVDTLKEYINEDVDTALEGKQDVINDLATIRSGAALGATAVQVESDPTVPAWAKESQKPSYSYSEITGKPTLSAVATSGSYNDLSNKPNIPTVPSNVSAFTNDAGYLTEHQDISGKANSNDLATVAFSGDYEDLTNTPTIPDVPEWAMSSTKPSYTVSEIDGAQEELVSGTNIKTINGTSILGSGNITIQGGGSSVQSDWNQTDTEAADYIKNKPTIPAEQVQSDWNQTNNSSKDFIKNKPTIPTVPTNVSAFTNDAGYLTQHQDISGKANKSEMSVTDGTGADADKTTITLKTGTSATVLKSHQSLSGKQDVIDSSHKLSADLVDDSNTTNKFTNATEKQTWNAKQDALVSGTNIKTINNESILGSGNITIQGGGGSQVQSDWNQSDNTAVDYIKNKPTIPVIPSNLAYTSNDNGEGIIPSDGIRAVTVTNAATMTINPDVVTVIDGAVGTAAITLQVPQDNLAHVWDILLTTDSTVAITFAMSNSATILTPSGFSIGASKAVEISVIGVGTKYYLRYGEFA